MNLRLLGTLLLGHLTTDLAQGMIPALLPFFIAERGLSFAAAGGLVLAATVASSIVQPLFGYFADRRPSPWLVPAGVAAAGIGIGLAGVAPTYPLIAAAVAFHGLGVAAFHPEGSRAAAYASGERRATGMSIFSTGGNLGMATGPLVITPLVLALGLKATLVPLLPILLIAGFLVTQLAAPRRPSSFLSCPLRRRRSGAGPVGTVRPAGRRGRDPVGRLHRPRHFLPLVFVGVLGTSKARGATALSILLGTGVIGTLAGGRLADRYGRRIVLLVGMTALAPLLFALASARDPRVATALLVPVALALYLPFSVLVVMGQEYLPNHVGTASGVTLGLAVTAGGLAAPILGAVADRWGIGAPLLVVSALPLLAVALALTLPDSRAGAGPEATRA